MGPEKWKGELPPDEAAERDQESTEGARGREAAPARGAPRPSIDEREEEGYDQPESSAQKAPPGGPGEEDASRE